MLGIETDGKSQRFLGLAIALEVEQRHPHVLVRRFRRRHGPHQDRFSIRGDGLVPSAELGECHPDILLRQTERRIELQRLVERGERDIRSTELEIDPSQSVPVDGNGIVERNRLLH